MLKSIISFDQWMFLKINKDSVNPVFDLWMPLFRQPMFWIPLYLFLILFMVFNFGKKTWWWVFYGIITVGITDTVSSKIFKPLFGRMRPCGDPAFSSSVRFLASYCGANGSFTSSHAANHFGLAMFIFITFRSFGGNWGGLFFIWAAVICYAQVYVGVHYPFDVLGGAVIGCFAGWVTANFFQQKNGLLVKPV
ncbi:MAG: phosphatase PAP2 family protein [Sphingobacteriales bacterium]|nr:phosphatase PAP2 family protein [Sphingobacteriales bacterium]